MKTSEEGIDLIKHFEGLRPVAYRDIAGVWTIGFGHTGKGAQPGFKISIEEAEDLLRHDVKAAELVVEGATPGIKLTQGQFDALVSFVFNLGGPKFMDSTILARIRTGDFPGAANAFLLWTKATIVVDGKKTKVEVPGLKKRRAAERELFLRP
jgi:lysozyme